MSETGARAATYKVPVNNQELLEQLRNIEPGKWSKVYKNGWNGSGDEVSVHFFQSPSGRVFDVHVVTQWYRP